MSWKVLTLSTCLLAGTVDRAGAPAEGAAGLACVQVAGEARPTAYGYRHVVILTNGCKKAAACEVSTDVNPQIVNVSVPPSQRVEVVTFLESPVYGFVPRATCRPHDVSP